jgi:hypothetical protein
MNPRPINKFLAALLYWMRRIVRRPGSNQGQAPDESAFVPPESPRDKWIRQYKTSRPPEDWLQTVATATEKVSARIPRPGQEVIPERLPQQQIVWPDASVENAEPRPLRKPPVEEDAMPLRIKTNPDSTAPAGRAPRQAIPDQDKPAEVLSINTDPLAKANPIRRNARALPPFQRTLQQQPSPEPASTPDLVPQAIQAESKQHAGHFKMLRQFFGYRKHHEVPSREGPVAAADSSQHYVDPSARLQHEFSQNNNQQFPTEQQTEKTQNAPALPVFTREQAEARYVESRSPVKHVGMPNETLMPQVHRTPPGEIRPLHLQPPPQSSAPLSLESFRNERGWFSSAVFQGGRRPSHETPEYIIESKSDFSLDVEEPSLEIRDPWPQLPRIMQTEVLPLERMLLNRQDQERAVHEQRGGW